MIVLNIHYTKTTIMKLTNYKPSMLIVLLVVSLFLSLQLSAQTQGIKGSIINEQGEAIPNATVAIKGTTTISSASADGSFVFIGLLPKNAILVISMVGYETMEYPLNGKGATITIQLKRVSKDLDEVELVSSGYQDIPKERATGSFVKIDNARLNLQVGTNILNRLDGATSGLLFNIGKQNSNAQNKTNISIRGLSTIKGPLDPIIVVDGFIYEGNITNINPNDVEDITVLKDAAAASIWGARAGNGVIIIATKRGKFNQRLQVSANANIIIHSKTDLAALPQMSSTDYIDVEAFLFNRGYFNSAINSRYLALTPATEVFLKRRNGLINPADSASMINALKQTDIRDRYKRYVYTNMVTQQYSVNMRGGTELNAYTFSVAYDKTRGELHEQANKLNMKVENVYRPLKSLQLTLQAYYTNDQSVSGMRGYNTIRINGRQVPYLRLADDNGSPVSVPVAYRDSYTDTAGAGKLLHWKFYPLTDYTHSRIDNRLEEIYTNIGLQYKLTNWLNIEARYQYQQQEGRTEQLYDVESYYARNLINFYSQLNRNTGVVKYIVPMGGILSAGNSAIASQTGRAQLNVNKGWKQHQLSAILGGEIRTAETTGDNTSTYGYSSDPLKYTNMDYVNPYPTFITGSTQKIPEPPSFTSIVNRFVSVYANAAYTFRKRYTLSASGRRDGSNLFGASTNDKWKPLWSVGGSWKISNEHFYQSAMIPSLRIRATYGYSGNVDLSRSAVAVGSYSPGSTINLPFVQINAINNPSLRWEQVGMLNLGIDFEMKNGVLSGSIEYYRKKGIDLYGLARYDYTTWGGSSEITRNVANMKGRGVDIVLNSKNIDRVFKWSSVLLFNYNGSKTSKYESVTGQNVLSILGGGNYISPVVGKPLYAIAAYKWGGLDTLGNPMGYLNGQLSTNYNAMQQEANTKGEAGNIKYIGTTSPVVFGSLLNHFTVKQLTLSVNFIYKLGYYFRKPVLSYSQLVNSGNGHSDYAKRWQQRGDELNTTVPSFIYPVNQNRDGFYSAAEINVLKADHIRLQFINLSYSFRKYVQVYVNAANLGIVWRANKDNLDPDYSSGYAPQKTWAVGVRANF